MVTIQIGESIWGEPRIIFTVPLPNQDPVYMSMKITDYDKEHFGVVIVDSEKFLRLWRAEPNSIHRNVANGSPETWPSDYKYGRAVDGFSHGRKNPVPLAYVSYGTRMQTETSDRFLRFGKCEHKEQIEFAAFTNGITRTIWLLTQGCLAFPVQCNLRGARQLFQSAAAEGTSFYTLDELAALYLAK